MYSRKLDNTFGLLVLEHFSKRKNDIYLTPFPPEGRHWPKLSPTHIVSWLRIQQDLHETRFKMNALNLSVDWKSHRWAIFYCLVATIGACCYGYDVRQLPSKR